MTSSSLLVSSTLSLSASYAVLRYVVVKGVSPWHLPCCISNKVLAVAGLLLACAAIVARDRSTRRSTGRTSFVLVTAHVLASGLGITAGHASTPALGLAALAGSGALAYWALHALSVRGAAGAALGSAALCRLLLAASGIHLLVLGLPAWLTPHTWPAGLPPLTLLAFLAVLIALVCLGHRASPRAHVSLARSR